MREKKKRPQMKILIAEDDFITSRALEKSLKDWGFDVSLAKNGNDAWALIQKEDIRLAIIDWMMPGIDGLELCHKIREKSQEKEARYVYIILLTGRDNQTDIIQGLTSGADDYMTKPFDFLELKVRLQKGVRIIQREESRILEASVDSLTKLWNRKKIFKFFQEEFERGHREKIPTGVIMIDIDQFKKTNDTYGHLVGDQVLVEISRRLRHSMREYDKIGRYGGDEFLIIVPGCKFEDIKNIAKRLRREVRRRKISTDKGKLSVNISCGIASSSSLPRCSGRELLEESDKDLLKAKTKGVNRKNKTPDP